MRYLIPLFAVFAVGGWIFAAPAPKAPDKIVLQAKTGNVTFDHAAHSKRENDKCEVCHPKPWPQAKGPVNYKAGMHKPAEAAKTSCGLCHHAGGKAFESKANCTNSKCHVKGAAKT